MFEESELSKRQIVVEHRSKSVPLSLLLFDDDIEEYQKELQLFLDQGPLTFNYVTSRLSRLLGEIPEEISPQIEQHIKSLVKNFFKAFIITHAQFLDSEWENLRWADIISLNLSALEQTIQLVNGNVNEPLVPSYDIGGIDAFALEFANKPNILSLIQIYTEQLLADAFVYDKSYKTGKTSHDSMVFYSTMAETLYDTASETTGDTEKQLQLITSTISWLVATGLLPNTFRYMDAGCGNGERILKPTLIQLAGAHIQPKKTYAADLHPPQQNEHWEPIWLDFSNPNFANKILRNNLENKKLDLITLIWSPINDLHIREQLFAIRNFVELLEDRGFLILEIPVGYEEEVKLHFRDQYPSKTPQPFGTIQVAFTGKDKKQVTKDFMINPLKDYIFFQQLTGLKLLNREQDYPTDISTFYTTQGGKKRAFLVFQKVEKQRISLAEMVRK
ncbi:MAG: hypothetical protein H6773_00955 [Pseudomonadales bacterium]|nr:hypothetical protein [Candidatus Woesebacteria bacterium]MCB9800726.1 hypothetical protein [Pseudomonadales bacterium]